MSYGENEEKSSLLKGKKSYNSIPSAPLPTYNETLSSNSNINNDFNQPNIGYQNDHQYQPLIQQPITAYSALPIIQTQVILVGGCPACRVGVLEDDYTCCGIFCAILFFPLGILCCLATKQRKCSNCGAVYG